MKKFFSVFLASIMLLSVLLPSYSSASNIDVSVNYVDIDEHFIKELTEESGTDFTDVDLTNFEEEYAFLLNDPVFRELEEYLVLNEQDVILDDNEVTGQWVPLAAAAIRLLAGKVGTKAIDKAWKIAKPHVDKALKDLDRYKFVVNTKNGRYLGIIDTKSKSKDKTVFALDYHQFKEGNKRTKDDVLHYHVIPNIKAHHIIYPSDPKWETIK
ncbi:hypothetical protein [Sutcliffiella halmapala]|uniref:hypothetical protein n=1 Tax=Sutcliffiella halmapala TaxID=79882 RepID=UPI000995D209|nr:hypothetical protein [Sutcliffiella halmapala]